MEDVLFIDYLYDISLKILRLPEYCCDEFFIELNFFHVPCLKLLFSRLLGIGIIAGSLMVKFPQIIKILHARSAVGISFLGVLLELMAITASAAYSFVNSFPFSSWGEGFFLAIQTVTIAFLVLWFDNQVTESCSFLVMYGATVFLLVSRTPMSVLWGLQASVIPIVVFSKLIQVRENYRNSSTGQLSAITVFMLFLGSVARIFTSIQETGDLLIVLTFVVTALGNGLIALQMVYYWNRASTRRIVSCTISAAAPLKMAADGSEKHVLITTKGSVKVTDKPAKTIEDLLKSSEGLLESTEESMGVRRPPSAVTGSANSAAVSATHPEISATPSVISSVPAAISAVPAAISAVAPNISVTNIVAAPTEISSTAGDLCDVDSDGTTVILVTTAESSEKSLVVSLDYNVCVTVADSGNPAADSATAVTDSVTPVFSTEAAPYSGRKPDSAKPVEESTKSAKPAEGCTKWCVGYAKPAEECTKSDVDYVKPAAESMGEFAESVEEDAESVEEDAVSSYASVCSSVCQGQVPTSSASSKITDLRK